MKRKIIGKKVGVGRKKGTDLASHPAVGMWADREDMKDVHAWLRKIRAPRYDRLGRRRPKL
jgi:ribosomal protein L19E